MLVVRLVAYTQIENTLIIIVINRIRISLILYFFYYYLFTFKSIKDGRMSVWPHRGGPEEEEQEQRAGEHDGFGGKGGVRQGEAAAAGRGRVGKEVRAKGV